MINFITNIERSSLHILDTNLLLVTCNASILSQSVTYLFNSFLHSTPTPVTFEAMTIFILIKSNVLVFSFWTYAFIVLFKKSQTYAYIFKSFMHLIFLL